MNVKSLMVELGCDTLADLAARSEVVDVGGAFGADVTAFVTLAPDGWAAWTDFEGENGDIQMLPSRETAQAFHLNAVEEVI
jgi:hypothetical protein